MIHLSVRDIKEARIAFFDYISKIIDLPFFSAFKIEKEIHYDYIDFVLKVYKTSLFHEEIKQLLKITDNFFIDLDSGYIYISKTKVKTTKELPLKLLLKIKSFK